MVLSSKCKHTYCRHQAHFAGLVGGCKPQTAEVAEFHRLLHPVSGGGGEVRPTGFDIMFMYVFDFHTIFSRIFFFLFGGLHRFHSNNTTFSLILLRFPEVHRKRSEDGGYPFLGCSVYGPRCGRR